MGTTRQLGKEEQSLIQSIAKGLQASGTAGTAGTAGQTQNTNPAYKSYAQTLQGLSKQAKDGSLTAGSLTGGTKPTAQSGSYGAILGGSGGTARSGGGGGGEGYAAVPAAQQGELIYNPIGRSTVLEQYESNLKERPIRTEGERTAQAYGRMMDYDGTRPGPYVSNYREQMDQILGQLGDREGFSYDPSQDQLYRNYRDQYIRLGNRAMQDTMAQAQGMTGGYGSSYAQGVGQQAYQDYLSRLNEQMPSLYNLAYQRYQDEGDDLYDRLNALNALDTTDYGRFRDTVGDWETDRNWWTGRYDTETGNDMDRYAQDLAAWQADRDYWKSMLSVMEDDQYAQPTATGGGGGGGGAGGGGARTSGGETAANPENASRYTLEQLLQDADKTNAAEMTAEQKDALAKYLQRGKYYTSETGETVPVDAWTGADPGLEALTGVYGTDIGLLTEIARRYGISPTKR